MPVAANRGELTRLATERILVVAPLVVGVIWLPIILLWGDAPFAVTFDDAWYYFEIGRNIAAGHGSTFDTINQTNGYHPLWMGISASAYALGLDDLVAVRALLALQLGMWVTTLGVVALVASRASGGFERLANRDDQDAAARLAQVTAALVLILLGLNPYVIKTTVNGLESGTVVLSQAGVIALVWAARGRVLTTPPRRQILLGSLLAIAFLARTDAALLIACLGLWSLAELRSEPHSLLVPLVRLYSIPAVVMGGWFAFSIGTFGEALQVSGEAKRLPLTGSRGMVLAALAVLALALAWRGRRRLGITYSRGRLPRTSDFFARTAWFAAFLVLVVGYYTQLSAQQWLWYFAPHVLYATFLIVLATLDFCEGVAAEAPAGQPAARAMRPIQAILVGVLVLGLALQINNFADPGQRSIQLANRRAGEWITANLPDDARLGSWDAGVVGYFTEQPVINLDGVVNSFEWLEAQRNGETDTFLRSRDLGYTVNHAPILDGEDAGIRDDVTRLLDEEAGAGVVLVHREEFSYSGRIEGASGPTARQWAVFVYSVPPAAPDEDL